MQPGERTIGRLQRETKLSMLVVEQTAALALALADTAAGYGCIAHLPDGAINFTTIELKSNFLGTARAGTIACVATPAHLGNATQIWDAVVRDRATGKKIALFRCTQMVLWPRKEVTAARQT